MNLPKPTGERLIVKLDEQEDTIGNIVILEDSKEKQSTGTVMAVGDYVSNEIVVGDKIVMGQFAGTEIEFKGSTYIIVDEQEVLGVIE